jgi:hypothetical protein
MDQGCGREHKRTKMGWKGQQGPGGEDELGGESTESPAPAARAHQRARGPVNLTPRTSERGGEGWLARRGRGGELEGPARSRRGGRAGRGLH